MIFKNKKASELVYEAIIPIILIIIFFSALFLFVSRTGSNISFYEQVYAKEIALAIDSSNPGTTIAINVDKQRSLFERDVAGSVTISDGNVKVKLSEGDGYSYKYFSSYSVNEILEEIDGKLFLKIFVEK